MDNMRCCNMCYSSDILQACCFNSKGCQVSTAAGMMLRGRNQCYW
jgi:hypothetical protein